MTSTIVFYATDTMADWEYGYLLAGLAMAEQEVSGRFRVVVASERPAAEVRTMAGLRIVPDTSLDALDAGQVQALVLPGANTWADGHDRVLEVARTVVDSGGWVAAICGGTLGLARAGLLDRREHTSNAADYLAGVPGYHGEANYREAKAVSEQRVITAPATAPVDFARAFFEALEVFPPTVLDAWYGLYTTGERRYFDALVGAA